MSAMLRRLRRMTASELSFRTASEVRKWNGRALTALRRPRWNRESLAGILARAPGGSAALQEARGAARKRNWSAAHRALAAHFASRSSAFPLDGRDAALRTATVASRFPRAADDARLRGEALLEGRYDLLGYTDLQFGHPPDWALDPVHRRRSPQAFWSSIEYLDPRYGDHKIVWELNRHQHWLTLGRAFALTGDARYYHEFVAQLEHWLASNPPMLGTNWASMLELAFRCLSWLWSMAFFSAAARDDSDDDAPWLVDLLVGMDRQLTHIRHNLSRYFSPNTHLTGEALALYVAGQSLPELAASASHAELGRAVLLGEIDRQIEADGGHAERSAHYHRYSTDFFLLALQVARGRDDAAAARFEAVSRRQAAFLRTLADDRGRLPLLGDDDGGQLFPICRRPPADCSDSLAIAAVLLQDPALRVGPPPEEAFWFCGAAAGVESAEPPVAWPSRALPATGYFVSRTSSSDHLVFDAGPHGFLNGGHAHSDALAVLLTVAGRPLLIDPGTATYTMDLEARDRFRSTAMHNTVLMNGRPQSTPRGPFHWESAANARPLLWRTGEGCDYVEGTHDGYVPLRHVRGVLALHGIGWLVIDHVFGHGEVEAEAFWHLSPEWRVRRVAERTLELSTDGARSAFASTAAIRIIDDARPSGLNACSPVYGMVEQGVTLHAGIGGSVPLSFASFVPATAEIGAGLSVEPASVGARPGSEWHSVAFNVNWRDGSLAFLAAIEAAGAPGTDGASPRVLWGTGGLRTDARVAALLTQAGGAREAVVINGTTLVDDRGLAIVQHAAHVPLARTRIATELASTLHQLADAGRGSSRAGETRKAAL